MQGYTDSVAFEFDSSILAKLHLVGVVTVAKNGLIFDDSLLNDFISKRTKKGIDKQLKDLTNENKIVKLYASNLILPT